MSAPPFCFCPSFDSINKLPQFFFRTSLSRLLLETQDQHYSNKITKNSNNRTDLKLLKYCSKIKTIQKHGSLHNALIQQLMPQYNTNFQPNEIYFKSPKQNKNKPGLYTLP